MVLRLSWVDSLVVLAFDLIVWFDFVVLWPGLFGWVRVVLACGLFGYCSGLKICVVCFCWVGY